MANKKINWGEELKTAGKVGMRGIGKFFQIFANLLITLLLIIALTGIIIVSVFSVYIGNYVDTEIDVDVFVDLRKIGIQLNDLTVFCKFCNGYLPVCLRYSSKHRPLSIMAWATAGSPT